LARAWSATQNLEPVMLHSAGPSPISALVRVPREFPLR
jgi:hypothetical protein